MPTVALVVALATGACTSDDTGGGLTVVDVPVCTEDTHPIDVAGADLDGDGHTDLVVTCTPRRGGPDPGRVEVHHARDNGFEPGPVHEFPLPPRNVIAADLTGDGGTELVVTVNGPQERTLVVLADDGSGGLAPLVESATSGELRPPVAHDLTGNGVLDVIVPDTNTAYLNQGEAGRPGPFEDTRLIPDAVPPFPLGRTDVDGSGTLDAVHIVDDQGVVDVLRGGTADTERVTFDADARLDGVLAGGDLNGDGHLDLVVSSRPDDFELEVELRVVLSDGPDRWSSGDPLDDGLDGMIEHVMVTDLDGDGHADLLVLPMAQPDQEDDDLVLLRGDGAGAFDAPEPIALDGFPWRAVVMDDGSGIAVVAMVDEDNRLALLRRAD